jgi:hypothetical protein
LLSSDSKAETFLSLALVFISNASGYRKVKTSHTLPYIRYKSRQNKGKPIRAEVNGYLDHINKYKFINTSFLPSYLPRQRC